ncbi:MAG: 2,5-dichloro-2,5-cyclohexadiene-1,4-diol dehydrogenase [Acidimicrobiaceae bacterium]|nr:MAG: 2,5-dichloro-2,5-cyclohexadiene-1,4-diol dehydrogenase [Acidimicrobiaceae bacterium]
MGVLEGKIALVTGAASGIGRSTAEAFAKEGVSHIALIDLDEQGIQSTSEMVESLKTGFSKHCIDVTEEDSVEGTLNEIVDEYGSLDIAFNNAGINHPSSKFHELELADWKEMIETNLTSVFICIKHEIKHMLESDTGGVIVNTSSGAGIVPAPGQAHYTAAKHGVVGLTKSVAAEYGKFGIRCNSILPGLVDTPMIRDENGELTERAKRTLERISPSGELIKPEQIAETVIWLSSAGSAKVNGQSVVIDGGGILR